MGTRWRWSEVGRPRTDAREISTSRSHKTSRLDQTFRCPQCEPPFLYCFRIRWLIPQQVLTRGQIYLNTSLTEAFGISIIEAASAGLFVVSTKVGGVPEILPGEMIEFARADEDGMPLSPRRFYFWLRFEIEDVTRALSRAIETIREGRHDPMKAHERVRGMYSWSDVAERTEVVYRRAISSPQRDTFQRLSRYALGDVLDSAVLRMFDSLLSLGPVVGPILCLIIAVQHWFFLILEVAQSRDEIDYVESSWSRERFARVYSASPCDEPTAETSIQECEREKAARTLNQ